MDHWRLAYLGIRQVPRELSEFELATFFAFSKRERVAIDSRRTDLFRLAVALHIGFLRMTGRPLGSYKQIPTVLRRHLGRQLNVKPPDLGTLRSLYDGNLKTLSDPSACPKTRTNFSDRSLNSSISALQLARHLQLSRGTVRKADLAEHRGRQPHSVNQSKRLTRPKGA